MKVEKMKGPVFNSNHLSFGSYASFFRSRGQGARSKKASPQPSPVGEGAFDSLNP